MGSPVAPRCSHTNVCSLEGDLTALVRQFWQQEEPLVSDSPPNPEDQKCEDFFRKNHTCTNDGRYMVRLPAVEPLPNLAATRRSTLRVLISMEKRFVREPHLQQLYSDFMRQYEELDHMSLAGSASSNRVSYLSHHGPHARGQLLNQTTRGVQWFNASAIWSVPKLKSFGGTELTSAARGYFAAIETSSLRPSYGRRKNVSSNTRTP